MHANVSADCEAREKAEGPCVNSRLLLYE